MAVIHRAAAFLTDHVAPRLVIGGPPRNQPSREELELQAEQELRARIALGRPGPEEWKRTHPTPHWAVARPRPTRSVDAVAIRLDALEGTSGPGRPAAVPPRPADASVEAPVRP